MYKVSIFFVLYATFLQVNSFAKVWLNRRRTGDALMVLENGFKLTKFSCNKKEPTFYRTGNKTVCIRSQRKAGCHMKINGRLKVGYLDEYNSRIVQTISLPKKKKRFCSNLEVNGAHVRVNEKWYSAPVTSVNFTLLQLEVKRTKIDAYFTFQKVLRGALIKLIFGCGKDREEHCALFRFAGSTSPELLKLFTNSSVSNFSQGFVKQAKAISGRGKIIIEKLTPSVTTIPPTLAGNKKEIDASLITAITSIAGGATAIVLAVFICTLVKKNKKANEVTAAFNSLAT